MLTCVLRAQTIIWIIPHHIDTFVFINRIIASIITHHFHSHLHCVFLTELNKSLTKTVTYNGNKMETIETELKIDDYKKKMILLTSVLRALLKDIKLRNYSLEKLNIPISDA
jgi:hypothetical protein